MTLALDTSFTAAPSAAPADAFSDAVLKHRPDYAGLLYWGMDHSLLQLPHLQLNWRGLEEAVEARGKPIGDLGACYSTLALEGCLRGVSVVPVDISFAARRRDYVRAVVAAAEPVLELYRNPQLFPAGFEPALGKGTGRLTNEALTSAAEQVLARSITADLDHMPHIKERAFSLSIAHDSVPKHSPDRRHFLEVQLPEILRVTDVEARIYPLARFAVTRGGTLDERLEEREQLVDYRGEIEASAARSGFSCEITSAYEYNGEGFALLRGGECLLGIFKRR